MTFNPGDEVVVVDNGYDDNESNDPFKFTGLLAEVESVNTKNPLGVLFYVRFKNPEVNGWYGEPVGTTWPFYANELEKVSADSTAA
jgi:hypothetical protein